MKYKFLHLHFLWSIGLLLLCSVSTVTAQKRWDNGGGDGQWTTAANWAPDGVPTSTDQVLLDNTHITGAYTVTLSGLSTQNIQRLTITPGAGTHNITFTIAFSGTGFAILNVGDNTSGTNDVILNNRAILINATTSTAGNGIVVNNNTSNGTFRINAGGTYIHQSATANPGGLLNSNYPALFSSDPAGVFIYDVSGTGTSSTVTNNITYGRLEFSNAACGCTKTYTGAGPGDLTITGNMTIPSNVIFAYSPTTLNNAVHNFSIAGHLNVAGTLEYTPFIAPTSGSRNMLFNGTTTQNIHVSGTLTFGANASNLTVGAQGATLTNSLSVGRPLVLNGLLDLNGRTLTLASAVSGTGTLRGGSTSNLTISGAAGTLNFDQSTPGTTNVLNNLTLSGTGTATLGNALNVVGNVSLGSATPALTTGGNLTLKSTAANAHATITGGTNASISGNVNVERFVPAHPTGGYSFLGHPLQSNPTFAAVTGLGASTVQTIFHDETIKTVSGTAPNQAANAWRGISSTAAPVNQGQGYGQWTTTAKNLVFTGAPQLSNVTVNLSFTTGSYSLNGSTILPGYNLLANPFPAIYPVTAVTGANIESTVYLWDKNNGPSGAYAALNGSGNIAPGQAFMIRAANNASPSVTFAGASRAASGSASMYRKAANAFILSYGQNWTDEMSVTFRDDATTGFDAEFDGRNLMGGPLNNEIYTLIDGTEYVLNNLPSAARSRSLAMGIRVGTPGRMSLGYTPQEDEVILEDRLTGTLHNFERGAYTFTAEAGKHDSRFVLHFNARQINSQTADALEESFYAFGADNAVGVAFRQAGQSGEVTVLDLTGRAVAAPVQVTGTEAIRIAVPQAAGLYLIRVRTAAGTAVKRVVVE